MRMEIAPTIMIGHYVITLQSAQAAYRSTYLFIHMRLTFFIIKPLFGNAGILRKL